MNTDRSESAKHAQKMRLHQSLRSGEVLLWEGGPADKRLFRKSHLVYYLLGLFLLATSSCMFYMVVKDSHFRFIDLIEIVSLLVPGICLAIGLPLHQKRILEHSWYGVTDQRVILFTHGEAFSLSYDRIPCVEVQLEERETFTIYLQTIKFRGRFPNTWDSKKHYRAAMVYIPDGPQVARLIRQKLREVPLD